jgi:hypothetical protein
MDQKDIDRLFKSGAETDNAKNTNNAEKPFHHQDPTQINKKGQVIDQISKVTDDSELGTSIVMNYMENVLKITEKQKEFLSEVEKHTVYHAEKSEIQKVTAFFKDTIGLTENFIFDAMDAFQFQDINRQKLMKVMHTLGKISQYIGELLEENNTENVYGRNIEQKTLEKDKNIEEIEKIIREYKNSSK